MAVADQLFGMHGNALALRSQRLALLASNIANAATPGYKARDIDFGKALDRRHRRARRSTRPPATRSRYRVPLEASLDGNTVELSTEQTDLRRECRAVSHHALLPRRPDQHRHAGAEGRISRMAGPMSVFDIAGRAMSAQLVRLNTTASNLANAGSVSGTEAGAFRAMKPVFLPVTDQPGVATVKVDRIDTSQVAPTKRHDPAHPLADKDGNVWEAERR